MRLTLIAALVLGSAIGGTAFAATWDVEDWFGDSRAEACRNAKKQIYDRKDHVEDFRVLETKACECEEHKDGSWTCSIEFKYESKYD